MPYAHYQVPAQGGDAEKTLNEFLRHHRVLKVEKQFVAAGQDSFWAYQVPRTILMRKLERLFGEVQMLQLWWSLIDSYRPGEGRSMPIGALTSQHLANFYLGFLDRFIKEKLRVRGYVRYMDDMVLWADGKAELICFRDSIRAFVAEELSLELKPPVLNRTGGGMDFLGFRFHPGWVGLSRKSRRRLKLRLRGYREDMARGRFTEEEAQRHATACLASIEPARSGRYRKKLLMGLEESE